MKKKIKAKEKIIIPIFIVLLIIILFLYSNIFLKYFKRNEFVKNYLNIYENNESEVFKLNKIVLLSSANAIDKSDDRSLKNLSIYQYTDIALYIDNGQILSTKNTINQLYIDNINLEGNDLIGEKTLNYKNILNFGLKQEIRTSRTQNENINFNIVYTNEENEKANYDEATFYTDCSNPITLEYLNYNIQNNYTVPENNAILFDGSILNNAGIDVKDVACKIKFRINLVNNQNEKYSCNVNFKIPLKDIYTGTTMKEKEIEGKQYTFFRHS